MVSTAVPAAANVHQRGARTRPHQPAADHSAYTHPRCDEPVVRHVRRGATTDALASLKAKGGTAIVVVLFQVRYSNSAAASNASLFKTWQYSHEQAFGHEYPPLPLLPITARILVMVGALFLAGGYRSYPNYVSIPRGRHLDADYEWDRCYNIRPLGSPDLCCVG